ncbi:hypothetical protein [Thiocystis violacea]|uniref:hypothetical protein n=1 Tax=Thiocystis violacea TaxID=13725 RepID=UPI0019066F4F|nr:hypothetical protein [Thiocystis violacea]
MGIKPRLPRFKPVSLNFLRLRPYGDNLLTPAVRVWLGFAWTIILLMASVEGLVWGLVGASIVPQASAWLRPIAGLFLFALIFAIIWIIDASLVMSERPLARSRRWNPGFNQGVGPLLRWTFGIVVRLAIVAISLYVTAPLLGKLIRADDIAAYHQRGVEEYFAQRDARLQSRVAESTTQIERNHRERIEPLNQEIERLPQSLAKEVRRRGEIEAEFAPELAILRQDLAAARQRVGDEILGRDGRPEGRGPEARKWETNVALLTSQLEAKQSALDTRLADVARAISELEQTLRTRSEERQRLGREHQTRIDGVVSGLASGQVEALPPRLTFAARSKALKALQDSPEERGVPHFETVEGFAQAMLGVLFFSLIALKLFEPASVRAYFSEAIQMQYRKYLDGGLADIPGFELPEDPRQRLNSLEFSRLWLAYEKDPASFFSDRRSLVEVREPLLKYLGEQALDRDLLEHRRQNLEQEMAFACQRRERELAAFDRELTLRTAQLQAQLGNETKALKHQRRIELATELQKAREDWTWRRAREEAELQRLRETFEEEQRQARELLRLREQEIDHVRERSQARLRQTEVAQQLAHQEKLAELEQRRQRESRKARLTGLREELVRLRALEIKQRAERQGLREAGRKQEEAVENARARVAAVEAELAARHEQAAALAETLARHAAEASENPGARKTSFWSRSDLVTETKTAREIERDLKSIEKAERADAERLAKLREELQSLELRQFANASEQREADTRVATTETRLQFYEDSLTALLAPNEDSTSTDLAGSPMASATMLPSLEGVR